MARGRIRDYGFITGVLPVGAQNSIADVPGVRVGHVTLTAAQGDDPAVCTGVTAILPHAGPWFDEKVAAAAHVINGYGKTTGLVQLGELGTLESPILLTNTFGVPAVTEGVLRYMMQGDPAIGDTKGSLNVVVGECNDGYLNDLRRLSVRPQHATEAIARALTSETVEEGSVGAGTGMRCFGWKGGIGTASRLLDIAQETFCVGALVLTNFGDPADLTILGYPVGRHVRPPADAQESPSGKPDGSIIIVIATDAPLDARQLGRLAKRGSFGLARTGSIAHHGSGDIALAFSTADHTRSGSIVERPSLVDEHLLSLLFRGVVESTEEAILNSLTMAQTTTGRLGRTVQALPLDMVVKLLATNWHSSHVKAKK